MKRAIPEVSQKRKTNLFEALGCIFTAYAQIFKTDMPIKGLEVWI